jgi:6-pyruvoyltetrahydropterin/6-carboxytetrahydropterin synthase
VRVTVTGVLRASEGGVAPLAAVDSLLAAEVTARLDGRHLNDDIREFADGGQLPTGEAIAVYLWERIAPRLPEGVGLHAVRVQEGPDLYAEYFGEA